MSASTAVQLPLGVSLPGNADLAGFVAGDNAETLSAVAALATGGDGAVTVYGGPGLGKSHLLQGAVRAAAQVGGRAAYLPLSEPGLHELGPDAIDGLDRYALVCLDDVQAIAGMRGWEEALVGLYDRLRAARAGILAASDRAPAKLDLGLADLRSRLAWGVVYGLRELDDADKRRLLVRRAGERGMTLPPDVARFLLRRHDRDLPALMDALDRLDRASLAAKRRLTIPFVKEVFGL